MMDKKKICACGHSAAYLANMYRVLIEFYTKRGVDPWHLKSHIQEIDRSIDQVEKDCDINTVELKLDIDKLLHAAEKRKLKKVKDITNKNIETLFDELAGCTLDIKGPIEFTMAQIETASETMAQKDPITGELVEYRKNRFGEWERV